MTLFRFVLTFLTFFLLFTACGNRQLQETAVTDYPEYSNRIPASVGERMDAAPSAEFPEQTPVQLVRLNFHFINSPKHDQLALPKKHSVEFVDELIRKSNELLRENVQMRLPVGNDTEVLPVRYQYVLSPDPTIPGDNGIYYHEDTLLCYFKYDTPGRKNSYYRGDMYDRFGVRKGEVVNVFMLELHPDSIGIRKAKGPQGVGGASWVKMNSVHWRYKKSYSHRDDGPSGLGRRFSRIFNHEVGHTLGLHHTWNADDGCDDTPRNPNCWAPDHDDNPRCPPEKSSNNVMDYNKWRQAFTPCQLGKVHYNFSKLRSTQRAKLVPQWCSYNPDATIRIDSDIEWRGGKDFAGDLIIGTGTTLTLSGRVSMASGAKIIVEPGGKLLVDGGVITNLCDEQWNGVVLQEKGNRKGEVEFLNGGCLHDVAE